MAIMKTTLNYTEAVQTNFSDLANRLVTDTELLLVEWGHFVPEGTEFIEVNVSCGWENDADEVENATLEFRIYQNGTLVFSADDQSDDIGDEVDTLTSFKAILTSPVNQHNVYQLTAIVTQSPEGTTARIDGPFTISTVSYGTA